MLKSKDIRRRLFVVGGANAGKSSLINTLWHKCKDVEKFAY